MMNYQRAHRYTRGQVAIMTAVFFVMISSTIIIGMSAPIYKQTKNANEFFGSRESYYLSEALNEDLVYRLMVGRTVPNSTSLTINGYTATGTIVTTASGKEVITAGNRRNSLRRIHTILSDSTVGVAFNYGLQTSHGGLILENTSSIIGNVYSNGTVTGTDNYIYGDVVSAGSTGLINNIIATGSAYAKSITNSDICGDAYYQSIDAASLSFLNSPTVGKCGSPTTPGTAYPGSSDQPHRDLPITDEQIEDWEAAAEQGGTISTCTGGNYTIDTDVNLGPVKITCNLIITNDPVVTLYGNVWVTGNITIQNTSIVRVAASLGNKSVVMVADNPSATTTSSKITLENSTVFSGSGTPGSHLLLISQNGSAENGGSTVAIDIRNTVTGDLLVYARHGEIQLAQNISLKEVTAYKTKLKNSAQIVYESGLANLLFNSGPSGGYEIQGWREIK